MWFLSIPYAPHREYLKKYGDYTFTFQAFNGKNEAGAPMQVKAQSGLLPATVTYTRVIR